MTSRSCRCRHCNVPYIYHPSGCRSKFNNDRYCSECYEAILKALESIPQKKRKMSLPTTDENPITIEVFKQKYEEWKKNPSPFFLIFYKVRYNAPTNFEFIEHTIDDVEYTLIRNKDTREELLEATYQEDIATKQLDGLWDNMSRKQRW